MKPSIQEYYEALRTELSARANHILDFGRFEKATDVLARLTDKEKINKLVSKLKKIKEKEDGKNKDNNKSNNNRSGEKAKK